MCGIAGLVGPGAGRQADRVAAMVDALRHRGPDEHGLAVFDDAVLGSARLSIIDPVGGHQPLYGPDERVAVVCNGEIYGHRRLRERYRDHPFRTGSDCEVILPLHGEYGDDLLHHLPGTFALALWDDRSRSLLAARDRFGERPLYFATTDEGLLAFASESGALLASGLFDPRPDPEMVDLVRRPVTRPRLTPSVAGRTEPCDRSLVVSAVGRTRPERGRRRRMVPDSARPRGAGSARG